MTSTDLDTFAEDIARLQERVNAVRDLLEEKEKRFDCEREHLAVLIRNEIGALKEGVLIAKAAADAKFEQHNNIFGQLKEYARRESFESLEKDVERLEIWQAGLKGMASQADVGKAEKVAAQAQESARHAQFGMWVAIIIAALSLAARFVPWGN